MNGWFLTLILMGVLNIGIVMAKHGESKENEKYNFFITLFGVLVQIGLIYMAIQTGF